MRNTRFLVCYDGNLFREDLSFRVCKLDLHIAPLR